MNPELLESRLDAALNVVAETPQPIRRHLTSARRPTTEKRERFAQLAALGDLTQAEAYAKAYNAACVTPDERKYCSACASRLLKDTDIILRIQELRRPIIRKLSRQYTYTLQDALRECEEMYDLAYANGNEMAMGRAIELKAKLVRILSDVVEHRHGFLDDASTAALLELKKELEVRKSQRQLENRKAITLEVNRADPL
jgi:hypothetical protein